MVSFGSPSSLNPLPVSSLVFYLLEKDPSQEEFNKILVFVFLLRGSLDAGIDFQGGFEGINEQIYKLSGFLFDIASVLFVLTHNQTYIYKPTKTHIAYKKYIEFLNATPSRSLCLLLCWRFFPVNHSNMLNP